jgi:hypothetical protein
MHPNGRPDHVAAACNMFFYIETDFFVGQQIIEGR